jgi:hypothetical protein
MADWEIIKSFAEKRVLDDYANTEENVYACESAIKELAKAILEIKEVIYSIHKDRLVEYKSKGCDE